MSDIEKVKEILDEHRSSKHYEWCGNAHIPVYDVSNDELAHQIVEALKPAPDEGLELARGSVDEFVAWAIDTRSDEGHGLIGRYWWFNHRFPTTLPQLDGYQIALFKTRQLARENLPSVKRAFPKARVQKVNVVVSTAKATKHYEAKIAEAVKQERERILEILRRPLMYFKTTSLQPEGEQTTSHLVDSEAVEALEQALKEGE